MLITGYREDENSIQRWKVENSWGKSSGTDGFLLMTKEWMGQYVFQILVNKENLTKEEKNLLDSQPSVIEPCNPLLGKLA